MSSTIGTCDCRARYAPGLNQSRPPERRFISDRTVQALSSGSSPNNERLRGKDLTASAELQRQDAFHHLHHLHAAAGDGACAVDEAFGLPENLLEREAKYRGIGGRLPIRGSWIPGGHFVAESLRDALHRREGEPSRDHPVLIRRASAANQVPEDSASNFEPRHRRAELLLQSPDELQAGDFH